MGEWVAHLPAARASRGHISWPAQREQLTAGCGRIRRAVRPPPSKFSLPRRCKQLLSRSPARIQTASCSYRPFRRFPLVINFLACPRITSLADPSGTGFMWSYKKTARHLKFVLFPPWRLASFCYRFVRIVSSSCSHVVRRSSTSLFGAAIQPSVDGNDAQTRLPCCYWMKRPMRLSWL